jgi:N-acetyl-anhydromuramyl-L-alanine amidase AmpD
LPAVVLPPLTQTPSPNQSDRRGVVPYLVVVHRPVGTYAGSVKWLCDPRAQASAHVITEGSGKATQLVPWDRKAWACVAFNSASYNIEVDDNAWDGSDPAALATAARIVAFLCKRTRIPPTWSLQPTHLAGVVRHYDLGAAGGGHTDPTTSDALWRRFMVMVAAEHKRGGFRPTWGVGTLARYTPGSG